MGVYADDLLATATSDALLDAFGEAVQSLELKCLGSVENFLGARVGYDDLNGYTIDQEQMITELLHKNRLEKANAVRIPVGDETFIDSESADAQVLPTRGAGTVKRPTTRASRALSEASSELHGAVDQTSCSLCTARRDAFTHHETTTLNSHSTY